MSNLKNTRGQATVITVIFLSALCGMAALVLDVGSWFRADRALQSEADAAALAGAQALPWDTGEATGLALEYAGKNGGGLTTSGISFKATGAANDTIKVDLSKPAPGFFSKVVGLSSVSVHAKATARVLSPTEARWAAPIGVDLAHPLLSGISTGKKCPCFGEQTTLQLAKVGPGGFHLLNLDGTKGGTGPQILADWMLRGFDGWLKLGSYFSDPGAKFNSSAIQNALAERIGSEMLFPIYDTVSGTGANLQYHVVGWVAFHLTGYQARGSSGELYGYFTRVIWEGIENASDPDPADDFGVRSIQLVD